MKNGFTEIITDYRYQICPVCQGTGIIEKDMPDENVGMVAKLITCPECNGDCKLLTEEENDDQDI